MIIKLIVSFLLIFSAACMAAPKIIVIDENASYRYYLDCKSALVDKNCYRDDVRAGTRTVDVVFHPINSRAGEPDAFFVYEINCKTNMFKTYSGSTMVDSGWKKVPKNTSYEDIVYVACKL